MLHLYKFGLPIIVSLLITFDGYWKNNSKSSYPHQNTYIYHNLPNYVPVAQSLIPPGNPETIEGITLGRYLFYDSILSSDYHHACASCHHQEYAFTDRGKTLSSGVNDSIGSFNSMPLFNLLWEDRGFFWNNRAATLESQIEQPVSNTKEMNLPWPQAIQRLKSSKMYCSLFKAAFGTSKITKENTVNAIAQFLRTIVSYNSKYDSVRQGYKCFSNTEERGYILFFTEPEPNKDTANHIVRLRHRIPGTGVSCFKCHSTANFTPDKEVTNYTKVLNNGIDKILVKAPSLRNLEFTAPYMHNGKFSSLDSVVNHYDHHINPYSYNLSSMMYAMKYGIHQSTIDLATPHMELSNQEKSDLVAFLNTLNDYSLITNKAYSNPFIK